VKSKPSDNVVRLHEPDDELVGRILAQDPDAPHELVRRYGRLMTGVLTNILGPREDIHDLLQETFLVVFRDLHKLREPRALRSWMISIAVGRARNTLRSERRRWWLSFRAPEELPEQATRHDDDDAVRAVYEAMERMNTDERMIFALRYLSRLTLSELADALSVSKSTAKRRLREARQSFDRLVEEDARLEVWLRPKD